MSQPGVPAELRLRPRRLPGQAAGARATIGRGGAGLLRDIKSCALAGGFAGAVGVERVYAGSRERVCPGLQPAQASDQRVLGRQLPRDAGGGFTSATVAVGSTIIKDFQPAGRGKRVAV